MEKTTVETSYYLSKKFKNHLYILVYTTIMFTMSASNSC